MQLQAIELQQRAEELVQRRTKSSLVKRRTRHDISHPRGRESRIRRNTQVANSATLIYP
jgi:hypothetical protein